MTKPLLTTRAGLTRCPACLSHTPLRGDLAAATCSQCGVNLVSARRADGGVLGQGAPQRLASSASGRLAAALGASLLLSACDRTAPNDPEPTVREEPVPREAPTGEIYGGPPSDRDDPPEPSDTEADPSTPDGAPTPGNTTEPPKPSDPAPKDPPPKVTPAPEPEPVMEPVAPPVAAYGGPPTPDLVAPPSRTPR